MIKRRFIKSKNSGDILHVIDVRPGDFPFCDDPHGFDLPSSQEACASMLEYIKDRKSAKVTIHPPQRKSMSDPFGMFGLIQVED